MKVLIAAIGKDKQSSPTYKLFEEYIKRLSWNIELKEVENKKPLPSDLQKEKEAALLLDCVPKLSKIIALDENGKNITSKEFAKHISKWQGDGCSHISFLIGGASGHGKDVLDKADFKLSFGKLTWPHMMVRAMLAEQIYRADTIISGHPYHKQ
jgi:23S rRNA (pseudouridine1915-N3)-methyltransferase